MRRKICRPGGRQECLPHRPVEIVSNPEDAFSTKHPTRPQAATKEDKAKISSTKSQTNSKLQTQMTKTEDGEDAFALFACFVVKYPG